MPMVTRPFSFSPCLKGDNVDKGHLTEKMPGLPCLEMQKSSNSHSNRLLLILHKIRLYVGGAAQSPSGRKAITLNGSFLSLEYIAL